MLWNFLSGTILFEYQKDPLMQILAWFFIAEARLLDSIAGQTTTSESESKSQMMNGGAGEDDKFVPVGDQQEDEAGQSFLMFLFGKLSERQVKILKRVVPHTAIMIAVFAYTIGGGYIFYAIEHPYRLAEKAKASAIEAPFGNVTSDLNWAAAPQVSDADAAIKEKRNLRTKQIYYEDEEDEDKEKLKKCGRQNLTDIITQAKIHCLLVSTRNRDRAQFFSTHYCTTLLNQLQECITNPLFELETLPPITSTAASKVHRQCDSSVPVEDLTPSSYIFMAFTIISTIGYGHVAPVSMWGRIFCIIYGLCGIPLALLAIADQGRFLSAGVMFIYKKVKNLFVLRFGANGKKGKAAATGGDEEEESMPAVVLLILFAVYMLIGGAILTPYEKDWTFVDAVYFTFISSSSIGFGDLLPKDERYLPLTLLYVALGLALSTAAIDVFAGYLRRLHHWGAKIRNCANKLIWFGGKHVTLSQLVSNIGVQLGVSEDKIHQLVENFDEVVVSAIQQVESGLPPAPPLIEEEEKPPPKSVGYDIDFIDERDDQPQVEEEDEYIQP